LHSDISTVLDEIAVARPVGRNGLLKLTPLCLCASVVLLAGCQTAPRLPQATRAIWVTRFDYKTPADVKQIIENCSQAGFNTVLFQVRGNGTAFYKSNLEPWADELGGKDPGFDPLELACREAHARDMELHAWVNVMPAWRGTKPPANPEQVYNKHPEWFWYDQHGTRQALSSFYVSLNPCLPEVRAYTVEVFRDLVAHYDVDGLHMDYIRFPNEPPAIPKDSGIDYPRDERTLALYREATGLAPDDDADAWNKWRTDQVTQLVADIQAMLRSTKPQVVFSASVGAVPKSALKHFQDGRRWADERLLDALILMNYVETAEDFLKRTEPWLADPPPIPVVPGLWFGRHKDQTTEEAANAVKEQIAAAREKTGNFCIFAYSSLFDSADQDELVKQSEEQRQTRAVRRAVLVPYLRELAAKRD
jgi:uncharacterized lipoprotein YddW (UPF0748 family)